MPAFAKRLTFKIGATVLLIELVALTVIGIYYINRFSNEIDNRLEAQIEVPGVLMTRGLLDYNAVNDPDILAELVDETPDQALIIGLNRSVFYATQPDYVGQRVDSLDLAALDRLDENMSGAQTVTVSDGLVNITPLRLDDGKLLGYLYLKLGTEEAQTEKNQITLLFVLGSLLVLVLTSFGIFFMFNRIILARVSSAVKVLRQAQEGEMTARIEEADSDDEIGVLQRGVNAMIERRQEAEKDLRQLNEELEDRVARRTRDLEIARQQAEDANRIKSQFLANMSHELRTPLNAILNFTGFVADGDLGPINEQQSDVLNKAAQSGEHLLSLINDILDLTKIEVGMMDLFIRDVDLNAAMESVISTARGLVKDKPVELLTQVEGDLPTLQADRRRIRQILLNLVSNAVKFTPQGHITIAARVEDEQVHISVADTGIGIAPEDQAAVFETFRQVKHDLPESGGTGLGMPICKHLVELHGGRIWLESTVGAGTTFHVELPVRTAQPVEATA